MCRDGDCSAHRLDGRLRQGAPTRSTGWPVCSTTARPPRTTGFSSFWIPQVPGYLDAMTAVALLGQVTDRIEIGTAVVPDPDPPPDDHGAAGADHAGRVLRPIHTGPRARHTTGSSTDQLGLALRPPGATGARLPRRAGRRRSPARARWTWTTTPYRVHSPVDVTEHSTMPVLLAALGPTMLRIAGERTGGTILWMADERAIGDYVVPRITAAAEAAGRPEPRVVAGVPVALCAHGEVDAARAHASEVLGHADFSPNYVRLLEHGDAEDVGDTMAAGDESAVLARLRRYRDAGVTDLAARVVPIGDDPADRRESRRRTQEFVASLVSELGTDCG